MAEQQQAPVDDRPATFAEGVPVPTVVPETPGAVSVEAPTDEETWIEFNTYEVLADLYVDGARAVNKGGKVPASHKMVPMWEAHGLIRRINHAPAPAPAAEAGKSTPTAAEEPPQPANPEAARRARRERDS
ncbi:hypothetical protein [Kineosporia babensis]|uniref:Uncharacterized protein n=1 Tax=Kineosporia babensis TaxID=499548 RepID=A0A9X1SY82_9ACTN|nr:hypothetical protein [Kineosporia babensis]MCD5310798.1 hypothetical protein [Kineosporia babensis]